VTVFQPHRYTRTMHLRQEFLTAFNLADVLIVMDIYAPASRRFPASSGRDLATGSGRRDIAMSLTSERPHALVEHITGSSVAAIS